MIEGSWQVSCSSAEGSFWKSLERCDQSSLRWLLWPNDLYLWRVCRFFTIQILPTGLLHLGNPVGSGACDPWQAGALTCLPIEIAPHYKCLPLVLWNVHVCIVAWAWFIAVCVCNAFILFQGVMLKEPGFRLLKAQINGLSPIRPSHCWKVLTDRRLNFMLPKFQWVSFESTYISSLEIREVRQMRKIFFISVASSQRVLLDCSWKHIIYMFLLLPLRELLRMRRWVSCLSYFIYILCGYLCHNLCLLSGFFFLFFSFHHDIETCLSDSSVRGHFATPRLCGHRDSSGYHAG